MKILETIARQPALVAVAYAMAREEGLLGVLDALPTAVQIAVEHHGAKRIIPALHGQEVTLNDGEYEYYISSIRALQEAALREEEEYVRFSNVTEKNVAYEVLRVLGYTAEDIKRKRYLPSPIPPR